MEGGGPPKIFRLRQGGASENFTPPAGGGHFEIFASANEDLRPPPDVNSVTSLMIGMSQGYFLPPGHFLAGNVYPSHFFYHTHREFCFSEWATSHY